MNIFSKLRFHHWVVFISISLFTTLRADPTSNEFDLSGLSLDELMQVEISTSAKLPETIQNTPASVYLIDRKDIERQGYSSITEVLENVPGLYNINNYNGISGNFGMRGYWNGRSQNGSVAFLVNGVPQARLDNRSTPTSSIFLPVESIDRIEIIKGPNSVMYGNGAFFGAINIITNDFFHQDQVVASYGSNSTTRAALRWSTQIKDFNLVVNAGHYRTGGLSPTLSDLITLENVPESLRPTIPELDTDLDDKLEIETTNLQIAGEWKNFHFDYSYNNSDTEIFYVLPPLVDGSIDRSTNSRLTLGYKFQINPETTVDTWISRNSFESDRDYDAIIPGIIAISDLDFVSWEIESVLAHAPSDEFHLTLGFNGKRLEDLHEYTHIPRVQVSNETVDIDQRDTQSAFAQINYEIAPKVRMIGGVRVERIKTYARIVASDTTEDVVRMPAEITNTTPRISLIYQVSESQQFKLMAGDATKVASTLRGNGTEDVRTLEAMYTLAVENTLLSISLFQNSLSNLLIEYLQVEPTGSLATKTNVGNKLDTIGAEVILQQRIGEKFRSELSITLQDSKDETFPEREVTYSPKTVAHGKLIYEDEKLSSALIGRYVSGMTPFYNLESLEPAGDTSGGYAVFDASIRMDNIWKQMYVALKVNNIFDKTIRYPLNPINSSLLDKGTLGDGRAFQITAGCKF
ncbi:TonB-dependent receptor [Puniceicoccaceae bacterium K14]|nr:TonB-dependent receptor [Puniceicoccaceae bacterium K14]